MPTVSATDLARNTRQILDSVVSQGAVITIERNQTLIAKLMPSEASMTARQALADLKPMLSPAQARQWLKESRQKNQHPFDQTVRNPWE